MAHIAHLCMYNQPIKCAQFVIVSSVLHGVSIEEQKAQVVWSRLQDVRLMLFGQIKGPTPRG